MRQPLVGRLPEWKSLHAGDRCFPFTLQHHIPPSSSTVPTAAGFPFSQTVSFGILEAGEGQRTNDPPGDVLPPFHSDEAASLGEVGLVHRPQQVAFAERGPIEAIRLLSTAS